MRFAGDYRSARDDGKKALGLLQNVAAANPEDPKIKLAVIDACGETGAAESAMGHLKEALQYFRRGANSADELVQLAPANASYLRAQVMAHGHVGDALGLPGLPNLGDSRGALAEYEVVVKAARSLSEADPADQRAVTDYSIALSRLATLIPRDRREEKLRIIREYLALLQQADRKSPANFSTRLYLGFGFRQLGDALREGGDRKAAANSYQAGLTVAESILEKGQVAPLVIFLALVRGLGEIEAASGNRDQALRLVERARKAAEPTKDRPAATPLVEARSCATAGFVYTALAEQAGHADATQRESDYRQANEWFGRSLVAWKQFRDDPGFGAPHQKEMLEIETKLAALHAREAH